LVIGGTSFAGLKAAVNEIEFGGVDGDDGLLPHAAPKSATAAIIANRFILIPLIVCSVVRSVE
jgi:hypothetical protein